MFEKIVWSPVYTLTAPSISCHFSVNGRSPWQCIDKRCEQRSRHTGSCWLGTLLSVLRKGFIPKSMSKNWVFFIVGLIKSETQWMTVGFWPVGDQRAPVLPLFYCMSLFFCFQHHWLSLFAVGTHIAPLARAPCGQHIGWGWGRWWAKRDGLIGIFFSISPEKEGTKGHFIFKF
jgi:hypothetical protein